VQKDGEQMAEVKNGAAGTRKPSATGTHHGSGKSKTSVGFSAAGVKAAATTRSGHRLTAENVNKAVAEASKTGSRPAGARPAGSRPAGSRPSGQQHAAGQARPGTRRRSVRRARLRLTRLDPWSVMRMSLLFSVTVGIVLFVVVAVGWTIIRQSGAMNALEQFLESLLGNPEGGGSGTIIDVTKVLSTSRILGFTALLSVLNVVLMTAIATLLSFLYNLAAVIFGGVEVTLTEDR
jgi:hypothetical protein